MANYSSWTVAKLKAEAAKIEKAIQAKENKSRSKVLAEMKALARKGGFSISELLGGTPAASTSKKVAGKKRGPKPGKKLGKVKPKYRDPKDSKQTWSGRGRAPLWVVAHEKSGGSRDDLLI